MQEHTKAHVRAQTLFLAIKYHLDGLLDDLLEHGVDLNYKYKVA